jgi:chromosome segregation ATPase
MFNLFPKKKTVDEILEDARFKKEAENLATGVVNSVYEIIALKNELQHQLDVNQKLQVEIESLEHKLVAYQKITEGASSNISELTKEILQLRHLKQENVELMKRVNEIDNDVIRDLQDQLFTLKNDYAVLKARYQSLEKQSDKEEPAFLNCACGDCYEKTKQYNQFHDDMSYQHAYADYDITGHKIPKEISWEEATSDLALRVVKLEEHIRHVPKIMTEADLELAKKETIYAS